jgi:sulfur carrier protein
MIRAIKAAIMWFYAMLPNSSLLVSCHASYHGWMRIVLNGEDVSLELRDAPTVHALLESKQLANAPCAVEVNDTLIPKRMHNQHQLHDGDRVEIVTLVGGG